MKIVTEFRKFNKFRIFFSFFAFFHIQTSVAGKMILLMQQDRKTASSCKEPDGSDTGIDLFQYTLQFQT